MTCDRTGVPLVVLTGPANVRDDAALPSLLAGLRRLPRACRARALFADRGYGFPHSVRAARAAGVAPRFAPRGSGHGSGLGRVRYVVEAALAWFGHYRRLRFCYERTAEHFRAFHELAACLICFRRLHPHLPPF